MSGNKEHQMLLIGHVGLRVTEVGVTLVDPSKRYENSPAAYLSFVLNNGFVIDGVKMIEYQDGTYTISMPNIERKFRCKTCDRKNPFSNRFCGRCGSQILRQDYIEAYEKFEETAHPISAGVRDHIEHACVFAVEYEEMLKGTTQEVPYGTKVSISLLGFTPEGALRIERKVIFNVKHTAVANVTSDDSEEIPAGLDAKL